MHENRSPNMCRVREGKFWCAIKPVYYLGQCKHADHAGEKAGIRQAYSAVSKRLEGDRDRERERAEWGRESHARETYQYRKRNQGCWSCTVSLHHTSDPPHPSLQLTAQIARIRVMMCNVQQITHCQCYFKVAGNETNLPSHETFPLDPSRVGPITTVNLIWGSNS